MLLILLIISINAIITIAEENDSFETRYIDLLPAKEKREFIETIARRILEEVKSKDAAKGSTEVSEDQLNKQSAYVSKLLKEEAETLRRRTKGESRRGTDEEDDKKRVQDKSIDFTLRELAHNPELEEVTTSSSKVEVAKYLKNSTDNISVEVQIVPQKKKKKKTHNSRIIKIPIKAKHGDPASTRENETKIIIGSENKPLPKEDPTNKTDDEPKVKLPLHITREDIFKNSPQKQEDDIKNTKKEENKQSDLNSENENDNYRNKKQKSEVKGESLKSENKVKNTENVDGGKSDDSARSDVRKENENRSVQDKNNTQIDSFNDKTNQNATAAEDISKPIKNSRRNANDNDDKDLDERDKSLLDHGVESMTSDTRKPPVGIEDDLKTFSNKNKKPAKKDEKSVVNKLIARTNDRQLESSEKIDHKKDEAKKSLESTEGIYDKNDKIKHKSESNEENDNEKRENKQKLESSERNYNKKDKVQNPDFDEEKVNEKHENKQKLESNENIYDKKYKVKQKSVSNEENDNEKQENKQKSESNEKIDDIKYKVKQKTDLDEENDNKHKLESSERNENKERNYDKKDKVNQKFDFNEENNEKRETKERLVSSERNDTEKQKNIQKSESNEKNYDKKYKVKQKSDLEEKTDKYKQKLELEERNDNGKHENKQNPKLNEKLDDDSERHENTQKSSDKSVHQNEKLKQKSDSNENNDNEKHENKQKPESSERTDDRKQDNKQKSMSSEKINDKKHHNNQNYTSSEIMNDKKHRSKEKSESNEKNDDKENKTKQKPHASDRLEGESKAVSNSEKKLDSEPTTLSLQDHPANSTQVATPEDLTNPLLPSAITTQEIKKNLTEQSHDENTKEINTVNKDDTINTDKVNKDTPKVNPTTETTLLGANKARYTSEEDNSTKMGDVIAEKIESDTGYDSKEIKRTTAGDNTETTTEEIVKARTIHVTWYPGHTTVDYDKKPVTKKGKRKSTIEMIRAKTRYVHWPTDPTTKKKKSAGLLNKSKAKRLPKGKTERIKNRSTVTMRSTAKSTTMVASDKEEMAKAPVIIKNNQVYIVNDGAAFKEKLTKRIELNKAKRIDIYSRKTKNRTTKSKKNKTKDTDLLSFQIKPFGINIAKEWSVFEVLPGEDPFVKMSGKPKKKSKKSPLFDRNNVQRTNGKVDQKNDPNNDDVGTQMEQPSYAPVYNYAPENAYYNPANRYAPPFDDYSQIVRNDDEDDDTKIERQIKEGREKGFLESDETIENHYAPVYNYAPENAFYNPENKYVVPDEENEQIFLGDTEVDDKHAERQRIDDEKIVKALLEAKDDEPEREFLFRDENPYMRKGKNKKKKKNTIHIPGSKEHSHPYHAMLHDNPPKTHLDHVREMLHRFNYFGYYHLVKTTTGVPTEMTSRFPINAPFTDKSGDPYYNFNVNIQTTDIPDIPTIPEPEARIRVYNKHLRNRSPKEDLTAALKSLLSPRFDKDNKKLTRTLITVFDKIKENRKQKRKSKNLYKDIVKKIIGLEYVNSPIEDLYLNKKLINAGPRGHYDDFDKKLYYIGRTGEDKPEVNVTESKFNETESKAEMINTMREILDITDATYIFPALNQLEKKYEKKNDKNVNEDKPVVRSLKSGVEKAHVELETQVSVLTDMLNADNRALENYDWLGTTVDIRGALRKLVEMGQSVKNDGYIHPRDLQLLKYVLFLFESVKDSIRTEEEFFRSADAKGLRPKGRRNQGRISERPWLSRSGMKQKLDAFVTFWEGIDYALSDLHDAIKHISIITKYRSQHWYKNLKELYLSRPKRKQVLEVLLHLAATRFVGLVEDSALNGAENNYVKYSMKHVTQVDRTRDELVFIVALLNELLKEY
ncbi:myb-like protein X [Pectinophora gossypiella]|uniref:myb-like protein X n=1 Tax=Pectinophora gossypiella TaxID=13191 RepID=UPI00214F2F6B|nr:myb-like protein X [Pectinophora gossypiella]